MKNFLRNLDWTRFAALNVAAAVVALMTGYWLVWPAVAGAGLTWLAYEKRVRATLAVVLVGGE
jgi:hypothetical protein